MAQQEYSTSTTTRPLQIIAGSDPLIQSFLDGSFDEMPKIGNENNPPADPPHYICSLANSNEDKEFTPLDHMPGGSIKILRENPTSAIVRFKAGSVKAAHHHTFSHDMVMIKGRKCLWSVSKGEKYELGVGDCLFTPAWDVHRVKYFEDTEFFIKWDGIWDVVMDEDIVAAKAAFDNEFKNIVP